MKNTISEETSAEGRNIIGICYFPYKKYSLFDFQIKIKA